MPYVWKWEAVEQGFRELSLDPKETRAIWEKFKEKIPEKGRITERQFKDTVYPPNGTPRPHPRKKTVEQFAKFLGKQLQEIAEEVKNGNSNGISVKRPSDAEVKAIRPARLHILRPVDMAYSNDIIFAFLGELYKYRDKISIDTHIAIPNCESDYEGKSKTAHLEYAEHVAKQQKMENDHRESIIVTVGTPPLLALRDYFEAKNEKLGDAPILFLGCTLPDHQDYGIVLHMENREERKKIAGVSYNKEIEALFDFLHNRVLHNSDLKLVYFYNERYSMDILIKKKFNEFKRRMSREREMDAIPILKLRNGKNKEPDKSTLYFGWHTAEVLFQDPARRELLQKYMIVSPTRRFVQHGLTAIGYQADDFEVGRKGAELLIQYLDLGSSTPLGRFDIIPPKPKLWSHRGKLREWKSTFGFDLPDEVQQNEKTEWFDDEAPQSISKEESVSERGEASPDGEGAVAE